MAIERGRINKNHKAMTDKNVMSLICKRHIRISTLIYLIYLIFHPLEVVAREPQVADK